MKKIYTVLAIAFAACTFATLATAQGVVDAGGDIIEKNGFGYRKSISEPNTKGIYTITLESFTTGNVTVTHESIPADIVLVLDYSGSMKYRMGQNNADGVNDNSTNSQYWSRMKTLREAVLAFIEEIDENDLKDPDTGEDRPERLGNRLGIVTFAGDNAAQARVNLRRFDNGGKTALINAVNALTNPNGGTYADDGMTIAYNQLNHGNDTRKIRTTVLFTDGDPGNGSYWESTNNNTRVYDGVTYRGLTDNGYSTWSVANNVINIANNIKNLSDAAKEITSVVYTVSVINNPSPYANVYLGKTSSNWSGATNMITLRNRNNGEHYRSPWNSTNIWANGNGAQVAGRTPSEPNYAYATTDAEQLKSIFQSIAHSSGGTSAPVDEGAVAQVDVVSASFMLPEGATDNTIEVYTVPYVKDNADGTHVFLTDDQGKEVLTKAPNSRDTYTKRYVDEDGVEHVEPNTDIDNDIEWHLTSSVEGGKKDKIEVTGFDYGNLFCGPDQTESSGWHKGYKLVVKIPIKMDKGAVGGPNLDTNGPGSGIYINGVNQFPFESPTVSLPVNIHIRKEGLKIGESAKFVIERSTDKTNWTPVTSVFVTRTEDDDEEGENAPLVKVIGMPATDTDNITPFIYRVTEESWSWSYNSGHKTPVTTDLLETNPFIFTNGKKDNIDTKVRNAETKSTNIFLPGETEGHYVDSKPRTTTTTP